MRRWLRDTLFLRLFVLMWVALVASHFAAYGVVTSSLFSGDDARAPRLGHLPTLPSLPPTPGVPDNANAGRGGNDLPAPPPPNGFDEHRPPPWDEPDGDHRPSGDAPPNGQRPGLPTSLLVVDYLVRVLLIGVAAAVGARWLTRPVRRLVEASGALSTSFSTDAPLPMLDEHAGTVEVREAARVFNRMARELESQFKSRGLLMASLSHDLKTPLTRMRMRLENLAEEPIAERCVDDIRQMNALLDTALDVFRSAANEEPAQGVDVHALLQSIADDRAEQGQAVTLRGSAAVALARPVALRRVVDNLIENALRYGGRADIDVARDADSIRVGIDDAGPGIAPELQEAVFRPFFRVEGSRNRASGGSGLGLFIARDLIRRQDGELTLANRPQGGLRALVVMPAYRPARAM